MIKKGDYTETLRAPETGVADYKVRGIRMREMVRRRILWIGIIMLWNAFFLTGCSQGNSSDQEELCENKTIAESGGEQQGANLDMPAIESYPDGNVSVEMDSQAQYTEWLSQMENYTDCIGLRLNLLESDVTVYLDEILAYDNFKHVTIENGGAISVRDSGAINAHMLEKITLDQIYSIDERLTDCVPDQIIVRIRISDLGKGSISAEKLLTDTDCQNLAVQWCAGEQEVFYDHLAEGDRLRTAMMEEQQVLGGFWKLVSGGYSYTEYEFNNLDTGKVSEAFICIKDQESNGDNYFDIVTIPAESIQELSYVERERMRLGDINSDGYQDIIIVGAYSARLGEYQHEAFLWNDSEKKYELVTEGRKSDSQVAVKKIAEEYEVKLYDKAYHEVFSMTYPKEPWIVEVTENILELGYSTGSPASTVIYFDKDSGKISAGYMNSRLIDGKYVAYMENEELIFTDIFNEEIYRTIQRDFAPAIDPVISIEMPDRDTILLHYYKGKDFLEVQEEIDIRVAEPEATTERSHTPFPENFVFLTVYHIP